MVSSYLNSLKAGESKVDFIWSRELKGWRSANMQPTETWSSLLGGGLPKGDKWIKGNMDETEIGVEG